MMSTLFPWDGLYLELKFFIPDRLAGQDLLAFVLQCWGYRHSPPSIYADTGDLFEPRSSCLHSKHSHPLNHFYSLSILFLPHLQYTCFCCIENGEGEGKHKVFVFQPQMRVSPPALGCNSFFLFPYSCDLVNCRLEANSEITRLRLGLGSCSVKW